MWLCVKICARATVRVIKGVCVCVGVSPARPVTVEVQTYVLAHNCDQCFDKP